MALDAGSVYALLGARIDRSGFNAYGAAMTRAKVQTETAEKAMTSSHSRMGRASAVLGTAAKSGAVAGIAAIGYAAVKSVKLAASFEAQLSSLKSVADASGRQMKQLHDQAMQAGAATKYSALQAAQAQTELAKGGMSVAQILGGGLKAALGLAAAGEMDLADAASTTANAINLFHLKAKDATHVADAMATAANTTTADVKDFAIALTQGGAAAKASGLSFDETMAALETLAAAGVKGSDAGTSLKTSLTQIANPTKQSAEEMKQLGLNFFDAHGKMKPLTDIAGMLQDKLGGLTKQQRLQAVSQIAGTDGMRTLLALYDAGSAKVAKYEGGLKKQGTAAQVAAEKQDNLKGKLENLQGSLETIGIALGEKAIPALSDAADASTKFLNDLQAGKGDAGAAMHEVSQAFNDLEPVISKVAQTASELFGGMAQSIGGVARIISGVVHTISALVHGDLSGVAAGIKEMFGGLAQAVGGALRQITAPLRTIGPAIISPFRGAADAILGLFSTILGGVADMVGKLSGLPIIGGKFKGLANGIRDAAGAIDELRNKIRGVPDHKTVTLKPEGIAKVIADLERLGLLKVPDKVQKILGSSQDAEAKVRALKQLNLPQKIQKILGSNLDALAKINAVKLQLAAMRDRTIYLNVVRRFAGQTAAETNRGHAAGRGPAGAETALVGEGAGPEWVVNAATGAGYRTGGPMVVPLAPSEYVIPTEPAHRGRALGLLRELAGDLGVAFAAGRGAKKKKPAMKVPARIALGGVPFGDVESDYHTKRDTYQAAKKDETSHEKQVAAAQHRLDRIPKTTKHHNFDRTRSNARDTLKREQRDLAAAKAKRRRLEPVYRQAEAYWREAKKTDDRTKDLESQINLARDRMDDANRVDDQGAYNTARGDREGSLRSLITLLQKALGLANPKSQHARELRERLSKLGGAKAVRGIAPTPGTDATFGGDLGDPALSDVEQAATKPDTSETEADRIKQTGMTDAERGRLADIDKDIALAGLTPDLADDRAASGSKAGFLEGILSEVLADPARGGAPVIAQIANDLKSAREDATAGTSGAKDVAAPSADPDLQAQLDQMDDANRVAEADRDTANQAVSVFGGPGDIGTGDINAYMAARSPIIIQTLHPADPATLRAVGDAATKGQALQPARTSPRSRSGF
jgi:TP901 family phage tail tape measure protein